MNHRLQDFFLSEVLDVGLQSLNFTPLDPCPLDDSRTREGAFLARTLMLSPCRRARRECRAVREHHRNTINHLVGSLINFYYQF